MEKNVDIPVYSKKVFIADSILRIIFWCAYYFNYIGFIAFWSIQVFIVTIFSFINSERVEKEYIKKHGGYKSVEGKSKNYVIFFSIIVSFLLNYFLYDIIEIWKIVFSITITFIYAVTFSWIFDTPSLAIPESNGERSNDFIAEDMSEAVKVKYLGINDVKKEFGLESNDIKGMIYELKKKQVSCHPDKKKESCSLDDEYYKVSDAIRYLREYETKYFPVSISEIENIIRVTNAPYFEDQMENSINQSIESKKVKIAKKNRIPRFSSASILILMSLVWSLPNKLENNPIISKIIFLNNPNFSYAWYIMIVGVVLIWGITFKSEKEFDSFIWTINNDSFQNDLFIAFSNNRQVFCKNDLVNYAYKFIETNKIKKKLVNFDRETYDIISKVSESIILKASNNNIIQATSKKTLNKYYKFIK